MEYNERDRSKHKLSSVPVDKGTSMRFYTLNMKSYSILNVSIIRKKGIRPLIVAYPGDWYDKRPFRIDSLDQKDKIRFSNVKNDVVLNQRFSINSLDLASLVVSYDDTKEAGFMNANIQIQKKGTYLIDICGFHLDYMKGLFP